MAQKQASREAPMRNPDSLRASSITVLFGWQGSAAYLESEGLSRFQSGVEITFGKKRIYRLDAFIIPFADKKQIPNYLREGLRGEVGLGFKKFFYGRLTGYLSKVYVGAQLRSGRHVYKYGESFTSSLPREKGYEWYMFLGNIGVQFSGNLFVFDISLSAGAESATYYHNWTGSGPVVQLGLSCGLRI